MSERSQRAKSPPPARLVNPLRPLWLPGGPCGLEDNHEDTKNDIWTKPWHGKHWDNCRDMLMNHDKKALDEWNDEINTQLVVSTLLAAVAGGFVVESQKRLSEDPAVTSAVVLLQIARQLNESIALPDTQFKAFGGPSPVERAFNSLFYASLGLSLANVTLGLLCLQWIRGMKYESPGMSSDYYPSLRYCRYLGFERWGAKGVISVLPLLLLAALLAFFAGLLAFASDADWISSIPLYIILPSIVSVVLFTTLVPGFVIILNMAFRKGGDFPSLPPFRSLQAWIAMQGFIKLFQGIDRIFKLNPLPAFLSFQKCLDWGQLDRLWAGWSLNHKHVEDTYLFPLILSTGTVDDMNTISKIREDVVWNRATPKFRKLQILKQLASYGERLPPTTRGTIVGLLFAEMAGLVNVGVPIDTLSGVFEIEDRIDLAFTSQESMFQLINSLSFLCRTTNPSLENFWNLFWRALADCILGAAYGGATNTSAVLFNDALSSMQTALENPSTDTQIVFKRGFKVFIKGLAYEVDYPTSWTKTASGSATLSTIISHSIWTPAREIIATLPPGEHTIAAQKCLNTLDRIRQKIPPGPAPVLARYFAQPGGLAGVISLSSREDLPPTTSPHIAIDIQEHKHDDGHGTSSIGGPLFHVAGGGGPEAEEDEDIGGSEEILAYDKEQPALSMVSTSFALLTPPIDSPTSPPPALQT